MKATVTTLTTYVKNNPKCTSKMVAAATGLTQGDAAGRLKALVDQGRLKRYPVSKTITGVTVFGYEFVGVDSKAHVKRTKIRQHTPEKKINDTPRVHAELHEATGLLDTPVHSTVSFDTALDALAKGLADVIVGRVKQNIAVELNSMLPEPVPAVALPSLAEVMGRITSHTALPAPKSGSKKVLIVGLLPQQAGMINSEFGDCFDLSFWKDDGIDKLRALAASADVSLVHIAHTSHGTTEIAKKHSKDFRQVTGGMSSMRDELTKLFVGVSDV